MSPPPPHGSTHTHRKKGCDGVIYNKLKKKKKGLFICLTQQLPKSSAVMVVMEQNLFDATKFYCP